MVDATTLYCKSLSSWNEELSEKSENPENRRDRVGKPRGMHIRMRNAESLTSSQINESLKTSAGIEFSAQSRAEVYSWAEKMLDRPGISTAAEEAARRDPGLLEQGRGLEPGTDYAADSSATPPKLAPKNFIHQRSTANYEGPPRKHHPGGSRRLPSVGYARISLVDLVN
jgi:hypothetical protein